jgi:hypothetical protein
MRRDTAHPLRAPLVLALLALCSGALGCGQDVLVGRWQLRSSATDAGLAGDAAADAGGNPQAINAERAREHARARESNKDDAHDGTRPSDKRH